MRQTRDKQERSRWPTSTLAAGSLALAALLLAMPSTSLSANDDLTAEDKKMLAAGELVMKQKNEQRGAYKMIGGQSWQLVDVPFEEAWAALTNFPGYTNFIPLVTEADVKHQAGKETDLAIRQQWGPIDVRYVLQTTRERERGAVMFRVDHSQRHDIRAGWGFIRARPYKGERTLVSFGALVDIGDGVFVSIIRPAVRRDLLRIPFYFKRHVEAEAAGEATAEPPAEAEAPAPAESP